MALLSFQKLLHQLIFDTFCGFCDQKKRSVVRMFDSGRRAKQPRSLSSVTVDSPSFFELRFAPVRRLRIKVFCFFCCRERAGSKTTPSLQATLYFLQRNHSNGCRLFLCVCGLYFPLILLFLLEDMFTHPCADGK